MWLKVRNCLIVAAAALVGLALSPGVGIADPWGDVDCSQFPEHADCQADVGTPGIPAGWVVSPSGDVVCMWDGEQVPCHNDWGWFSGGCYYRQIDAEPPTGAETPGAAYVPRCIGDLPNGVRPAVWLPDSEAPGPGLLAQIAVSRLSLPPPAIELSPPVSAPQLVMLPTWLWVEPQWWQASRSASASVPGITVVAVATPTEVLWDTGDGGEYVCGRGTPYTAAEDPAAASPDCGHTYTRTGVYTLAGTVTWQVDWSGGGAAGTIGPLFSTTSESVEVVESLTRNIGGQL